MSAAADTLKKIPLFADLKDKELQRIASQMTERRYRAGDTVTEQGSSGIGFFVIENGTADIVVDGEAKGSVGPGDYFGEVALLSGSERTRTATLTAATDMLTYGMAAWDFKPLIASNADLASKIASGMAAKLS
jgi:CRP/FNR family transcriptional regulator, cyclic AMP receptor protein